MCNVSTSDITHLLFFYIWQCLFFFVFLKNILNKRLTSKSFKTYFLIANELLWQNRIKLSSATRSPAESYIHSHCYCIKICSLESLIQVQGNFFIYLLKLDTPVIQFYHSTSSIPAPISLLVIRKCPGWDNGRWEHEHERWLNWAVPLLPGQLQLFEFPLQALWSGQRG